MGTKQVLMEFQVVADDGVSANVTVTVGGVQKFSGQLNQTVSQMPLQVLDDQMPYSSVQFDLDVENLPSPPPQDSKWITTMDVTIAVTGGSITLQATEANYCATMQEVSPPTDPITYQFVPGNSTAFPPVAFANQPVWTPEPADPLDRFNYQYNVDNNTGPGSLPVLDGEVVEYQVQMPLYSAA